MEHVSTLVLSISTTTRVHPGDLCQSPPSEREFMGIHLRIRRFTLTEGSGTSRTLSAVRLRRRWDSSASLVVVTEYMGEHCRLQVPPKGFPRIFCRFPVHASDFLPVNAVMDGRFDLRQERDRVLMKDGDKEQIDETLRLLPMLVQLALEESWIEGHKLAYVSMPDRFFGEKIEGQKELESWWRGSLSNVAQMMSEMSIVQTSKGLMKASGVAPLATFVVPRFGLQEPKDELDFDSVWEVASKVVDVHLPARDVAADWSLIVSGWTT